MKDFQVEKVKHAPFFSTYRNLAEGKPLKYWYIDWEAWWATGGPKNKDKRPKDFLTWVDIDLALPILDTSSPTATVDGRAAAVTSHESAFGEHTAAVSPITLADNNTIHIRVVADVP